MTEGKDPAIKLFGKAIPLPPPTPPPPPPGCNSGGAEEDLVIDEALSCETKSDTTKQQDNRNHNSTSENGTDQNKTLKKPEKILPCPRCKSMDTKFCYYNNYNVSQPRHFCKNCQRYWTAGGTMRNVPVGAGRRRNKIPPTSSQYCHISVSQALQNGPNGAHFHRPNGMVLARNYLAACTPLSESIADQKINNCGNNGYHKPENIKILVPNDDQSSNSLVTAANAREINHKKGPNNVQIQNFHSYPPQVPFFAAPPWPYLWVPLPGVIPSGYQMPFYPAPPYWGYVVPPPSAAPFVDPPLSTPTNSSTLRKHCRDETAEDEDEKREDSRERSIWMPKTLRIDDPGEAAKSSIWATLGIKPEKGELFKAFQSKASDSFDTSSVLQANPAALSRSRNFQESS